MRAAGHSWTPCGMKFSKGADPRACNAVRYSRNGSVPLPGSCSRPWPYTSASQFRASPAPGQRSPQPELQHAISEAVDQGQRVLPRHHRVRGRERDPAGFRIHLRAEPRHVVRAADQSVHVVVHGDPNADTGRMRERRAEIEQCVRDALSLAADHHGLRAKLGGQIHRRPDVRRVGRRMRRQRDYGEPAIPAQAAHALGTDRGDIQVAVPVRPGPQLDAANTGRRDPVQTPFQRQVPKQESGGAAAAWHHIVHGRDPGDALSWVTECNHLLRIVRYPMARFTPHGLLADSKEHLHRCEERYGSSREPDTQPIIDRAGRE